MRSPGPSAERHPSVCPGRRGSSSSKASPTSSLVCYRCQCSAGNQSHATPMNFDAPVERLPRRTGGLQRQSAALLISFVRQKGPQASRARAQAWRSSSTRRRWRECCTPPWHRAARRRWACCATPACTSALSVGFRAPTSLRALVFCMRAHTPKSHMLARAAA